MELAERDGTSAGAQIQEMLRTHGDPIDALRDELEELADLCSADRKYHNRFFRDDQDHENHIGWLRDMVKGTLKLMDEIEGRDDEEEEE